MQISIPSEASGIERIVINRVSVWVKKTDKKNVVFWQKISGGPGFVEIPKVVDDFRDFRKNGGLGHNSVKTPEQMSSFANGLMQKRIYVEYRGGVIMSRRHYKVRTHNDTLNLVVNTDG